MSIERRDIPPTAIEDSPDNWPRGSVAAGPFDSARADIPQRFGSYVILEILGRGGMGVVYRAEQAHPRRAVALKVLPLGLLTSDRLVRRFDHEVAVLGRLHHPGIAQVYEAGMADGGFGLQPFFAMELIDGAPLTRYATTAALGPRQRLELLARICDAVHYAHQQGVIHRDLKPANVLVESAGHPKVLDFGVARATETDTKWTLAETEAGLLIGTLPYMSPEQAAGAMAQMDTRSDVYALGVIAFELLAGRLPHELAGIPLHDAVRIICDVEPARLGATNRSFHGDVETIVCKAMHKEKQRRYDSAAAFAADIRRYLNDEPIAARPPTPWYQLAKFARRNRSLVAAVLAVFFAMLIGAAVALWQKRQAELQLVNAGDLNQFVMQLFTPSDDGDSDAAFLGRVARVDPPTQPLPLASVYCSIAAAWDALEAPEKSAGYWRRALELRQRHLGEDKAATVDAAVGLATALLALNRVAEAEHHAVRARYCATRALGPADPHTRRANGCLANVWARLGNAKAAISAYDQSASTDVLRATRERAGLFLVAGDADSAIVLFEEVLDRYERLGRNDRDPEVIAAMYNLGTALLQKRDPRAVDGLEHAFERFEETRGPDKPETLNASQNLAIALYESERFPEAEAIAEKLVRQRRAQYRARPDHPILLQAVHTLARCTLKRLSAGDPVDPDHIRPLYEELLKANGGTQRPNDPIAAPDILNFIRHGGASEANISLLEAALQRYPDHVDKDMLAIMKRRLEQFRQRLKPT